MFDCLNLFYIITTRIFLAPTFGGAVANKGFYGPNEGNRKAKSSVNYAVRGNFRPSQECTMRGTPKVMAKMLLLLIVVGIIGFLLFAYFCPPELEMDSVSLIPVDSTTKIEVNGTMVALTHNTSWGFVYAHIGRSAFPITEKRTRFDSFDLALSSSESTPPGFVAIAVYR